MATPYRLEREPLDPDTTPPSVRGRTIAIGVLAAVLLTVGLALITRSSARAMVWIVNPGPEPATITLGDTAHRVEAGKTLDVEASVEAPLDLTIQRGDQPPTALRVEVGNLEHEVTLIDLDADATYVVADVSSYYGGSGLTDTLPILGVSQPTQVHRLPHPAARLVRPGRDLPAKDSWDLAVFRDPDATVHMYKVFRVEPSRAEDQAGLAALLREGVATGGVHAYENMLAARPDNRREVVLGETMD